MKRVLFVYLLCTTAFLQLKALNFEDKSVDRIIMLNESITLNPASDLGMVEAEIMSSCYDVKLENYDNSAFEVSENKAKTDYRYRSGMFSDEFWGHYSLFKVVAKKKGKYIISAKVTYMLRNFGTGAENKTSTVTYNINVLTVEGITLAPNPLSIMEGNIYPLSYSINPQGAQTTLKWSSSNTTIATVDYNGIVEAKKAGTATITCTASNGVKGTCTVQVNSKTIPVSTIVLDNNKCDISISGTIQLSATISPSTASNKNIKWYSSDVSVAKVSNNGLVTGVGVGNAIITCEAEDGSGAKATCNVTVKPTLINKVTLNYTERTITQGQTFQLAATLQPSNAYNKALKWSSSNTSVATVSNTGEVTGVGIGNAVITCEAKDGGGAKATCNVTVNPILVSKISLNYNEYELKKGQVLYLSATIEPSNANNKAVKWSSSDSKIAKVNDNGQVTAVSVGSCIISALTTDGTNLKDECIIIVKALNPGISFADAVVKRICVENWDTNGDGELSKEEAAKVTDISNVFKDKKDIKTFDELQHFTALKIIPEYCFYNTGLTSVVLPENIIEIGTRAFSHCNLETITIPAHVSSIGSQAFFDNWKQLSSVISKIRMPYDIDKLTFSNMQVHTGGGAIFDTGVTNFTKATLYVPAGTKERYQKAEGWKYFNSIEEIVSEDPSLILESLTIVGDNLVNTPQIVTAIIKNYGSDFDGIISLYSKQSNENKNILHEAKRITIASGATKTIRFEFRPSSSGTCQIWVALNDNADDIIDYYITKEISQPENLITFADAEVKRICVKNWDANDDGELSEAEAADVKSLGYAFGLSSITTFEELRYFTGLTTIDEHAFDRCPNLQSVTLPAQVTSIGRAAFSACGALTTVILPEFLTTIGEMSFERCSGLKFITIPSKVTSIGRAAFSVCSSLTTITLPEGLTSIPELCFERCTGLKSINIPASVNSIGNNAFAQCNSLEEIASELLNPFDIDASVFTNSTYTTAKLNVPKGTKSKYCNASGWKNFTNIKETGVSAPELVLTSLTVKGSHIAGEWHDVTFSVRNDGDDYNGVLHLWSSGHEMYIDHYDFERHIATNAEITITQILYFDKPEIWDIWVSTDSQGHESLGRITYDVNPVATFKAFDYVREYGEANPDFHFSVETDNYKGTPLITCKATKTSSVGTYPITIERGSVDSRYYSYQNGMLTIIPAKLSIKGGVYNKKQGEENPEFILTYEGFKNEETEDVLTKKPVVNTTADRYSPVGVYDVFVSGAEAQNYEISYVAGTLTIEKGPKGDLDAKGYTDVTDVVAAINHVLGKRILKQNEKDLLDMNDDGELNVGDIILLVKNILEQGNQFEVPTLARGDAETVDLSQYTAMQLIVNVPAGSSIRDIRLAGGNSSSHQLSWQMTDNGRYTVVVYSMGNQRFKPVSGCLLEIDVEGEGESTTANVLLATPDGERMFINSLPIGTVTGISFVNVSQAADSDVYDLRGNKVLDKGMSMKCLLKGVYIINGKKIIR